jgi:RHS repeat-associated protein
VWQNYGVSCHNFEELYFYHPDYLSNTEYVTDAGGYVYQYLFYSPFGESLYSQHAQTGEYNTPHRFNAKELDVETGNYYYGARYYNPRVSVWLSVDPLAHKGPNLTPYAFTHYNPIVLVDPDGKWPGPASLVAWFSSVMNEGATQTARHKFNEIMDLTANARGYERRVRKADFQTIWISGFEKKSLLMLSSKGNALTNEIQGTSSYSFNSRSGKAFFRGYRKDDISKYNVTSIDFREGKKGRGVSGGGFGGNGFTIELLNANNDVALMLVSSKQEFEAIKSAYFEDIDNQFQSMLDKVPMAKDYYNNVYPTLKKAESFRFTKSESEYQNVLDAYQKLLNEFNSRWDATD